MKRLVILILAALLVLLVAGCQRGEAPLPEAQAREELEGQVLDYILEHFTRAPSTVRSSVEEPDEDFPRLASTFIVLASPKAERRGSLQLDSDRPHRAWWQWDVRLVEARDPVEAYARRKAGLEASPWIPQDYIEFGILSISPSGREATVYIGEHCGGWCGSGYEVTFERGDDGQWRATKEERVWVA